MPESAATSAKARKLRITEIFYSLQGETRSMGVPTVFIRLTGCPLRCGYCDTSYAFTGGQWMTFDDILAQVRQHNTNYVTVTGGEPLAQKECAGLLTLWLILRRRSRMAASEFDTDDEDMAAAEAAQRQDAR